ncbi:verprolin [Delitschia confertaspora ATCC 74209]|uniref:Verprolin n=1 Tax=Delitschia confertaspora ATCC 74209 TaxID=1513339 RepID=A0A9P4MRY9_9PLEO|nr:verprolin [Delitschia confertaspora ATCC 74209]
MPEILSTASFDPSTLGHQRIVSPLDQRHTLNSVLEDDSTIPRYYFTPRYSPTSATSTSHVPDMASPAYSEDFPTPRAHMFNNMTKSPAAEYFPAQSYTQHRVGRAGSDFDSLYDITDDEAEVPLKCSASVKKVARTSRNRYPSIVIPSPSAWPTIEKLKSAMSAIPPTPSQLLTPSTKALTSMAQRGLQVPATSATPSLDGSMTSEEMEHLSCPSTPETTNRRSMDMDWEGPVQLDTQAFETLQHLGSLTSGLQNERRDMSQVIEVSEGEMQEVSRPSLGLTIPSMTPSQSSGTTPVSALSIPSPGGFFSSLGSSARHTWSMPKRVDESVPNTSTAEKFYQLPWNADNRRNTIAEQTITLAGSTLDGFSEGGLPTARPAMITRLSGAREIKELAPIKTIFQYNETYQAELEKQSTANFERTGDWLKEQDELQAALREMELSPTLSPSAHSRGNSIDKAKKSVRFQEEAQKSPMKEESPKKCVTYVQGWEYLRSRSRENDPFIHRQTRAEALHVHRRCMPQFHRNQLIGKYELTNPVRPAPPRPVSEFYTDDPTVLKERIARAQMERQALDQILPINWVLQALKQLSGGKLLSREATRCISRARSPRILDVGGVVCSDWAWQAAYDYPYATVTTVYTAGNNPTSNVKGPDNHKTMVVPNLWTLPFPSGHFDVISARTLHELLKTDKPLGRSLDEYDLCIKECFRCLKPGGILEFSLLDADIIHAGRQAQAMSVEFGFNLKTRGYDAAPTKSFLPRLSKAGFREVQRAWMVLPMGKPAANWKDVLAVGVEGKEEKCISPGGNVEVNQVLEGTTKDAAMMTGTVGAWAWEKWMLKLQMEMGKDEDRLLEGVVQVLEEGAREGAGWRWLTGFARK